MSDLVKVLASYLSFISEKPTRNPRFCPPNQNHLAVIDELWTGAVAISQPCNDVFSWCNMDTLFVKGRCWCWGKGQSVVEKYNTNVNLVFMANKDQLLRPRLCLGLCWSLLTIKSQSWFSEERNTTQHTCPYYWSFCRQSCTKSSSRRTGVDHDLEMISSKICSKAWSRSFPLDGTDLLRRSPMYVWITEISQGKLKATTTTTQATRTTFCTHLHPQIDPYQVKEATRLDTLEHFNCLLPPLLVWGAEHWRRDRFLATDVARCKHDEQVERREGK